jgi:hypothetical protein
MRRLEAFLRFLWDFVVGDDWRIAAGVVVALSVTALIAGGRRGCTRRIRVARGAAASLTYSCIDFTARNSSRPWRPSSRPCPDCL